MADRAFVVVSSDKHETDKIALDLETLGKYGDVCAVSYHDKNMPKLYNQLLDEEKKKQSGKHKFLHIIDSNVELLKDPQQFLEELEDMMVKLDYHVWLSTVCDECNYVFGKYNPRIRVSFDDDKSRHYLKTKAISLTSNSNTTWIAYDLTAPSEKLLKFDEQFEIAMYYIIELLARRRNTKDAGSLYYMNQYITVDSELGTYRRRSKVDDEKLTQEQLQEKIKKDQEDMIKENEIFQSMKINIEPDNSVDAILEDLYKKLKSKNV